MTAGARAGPVQVWLGAFAQRFCGSRLKWLAWWLLLLALGPTSAATVWTVAPGQSLAQTVQKAADGDVVELLPGDHRAQVAVLEDRVLTLRGAASPPGRVVLHAAGAYVEGKGILVVRGGRVRVENLEFRGTRVPDQNGAGIRFDRGHLVVHNCAFFDNQNGILTGNVADAELVVENSEFGLAPAHTPLPHLIYVGRIARFVLQGSRLTAGHQGHLVKSRARVSEIRYNHIVDSEDGEAAYELEFPNGGTATVVGNVIGQSANSSNPTIVSFGAEGDAAAPERQHALLLLHNTFVNTGLRPALFVRVHEDRLRTPVQQRWVNNLFVGLGVADVVWGDLKLGNFLTTPGMLQDPAKGAYALQVDAWLRSRGVQPEALDDSRLRALWPNAEFAPPVGTRPLALPRLWAPGAHQP